MVAAQSNPVGANDFEAFFETLEQTKIQCSTAEVYGKNGLLTSSRVLMQIAQGCCDGFRIQALTAEAGISVGFLEQGEGQLFRPCSVPSKLTGWPIQAWSAAFGSDSNVRISRSTCC